MLKTISSSAVYIIYFLLAGCATSPEESNDLSSGDSMYRLAENMKKAGDYGTAIKLYHQALMIDPEYKNASLGLADTLKKEGKFEECRTILDKLLVKNPDDPEALHCLGKLTIAQNDGEGCLKTYTSLHKTDPQNPFILNGLAICHDLLRQHPKAHSLYKEAITLAPDNLNFQSNYGLSLALSGRTQEAIALLSRLTRNSRTTLNIKHNLAVAYGLAGQNEKAKQLFSADLEPEAVSQNMSVLKAVHSPHAGPVKGYSRQKKATAVSKDSLLPSRRSPLNLNSQETEILPSPPIVLNKITQESLSASSIKPAPPAPAKPPKKKKKQKQGNVSATKSSK